MKLLSIYNYLKRRFKKSFSHPRKQSFVLSNYRLYFFGFIFIALVSSLVVRLCFVMVINKDFYVANVNNKVLRTSVSDKTRGMFYDRNMEQLAISVPVYTIVVENKIYKDAISDANKQKSKIRDKKLDAYRNNLLEVCTLLNKDCTELQNKLNAKKNTYSYLVRQVPENIAELVKKLHVPGIYPVQELRRYYPTGEVDVHIIGRTNIDGVGIDGLEKVFNDYLISEPTKQRYVKDINGNVIANLGVIKEGKKAQDIVLSIDQRLQDFAYKSLKYAVEKNQATSGSLVLVDVKTGEILAIANSPSYNPNNGSSFESYRARNRAVTDLYEPGSTTKPLIAINALDKGITNWRELFNTKPFQVNRKIISDSHRLDTGTLFDIIKYSSNTGMARIALRSSPEDLTSGLRKFGYGSTTGSGLLGESKGRIPYRKRWSDIEKATLGFGYGIMVTPIQIAQAYTVIANKGKMIPLSILKVNTPPHEERIFDEKLFAPMLNALEAVVEDGGTGEQALITGYRVGGKTGTAKVAVAGGYGKDYVGTFVGMAPMSDPRFVLVVIINEPHAGKFYGGIVAGPVFSQVMSRTLQLYNIPPDDINPDGSLVTIQQKIRRKYHKK